VTNLKGTTIVCKNESPDMYASIDASAHALQRKLCKYKERRTEGWHGGTHMGEEFSAALEAMEETTMDFDDILLENMEETYVDDGFIDPEQPSIVKVESFQLDKAISLDEAVFALDYVDHDFYVFRNEATNEINVVYKRHAGGVGLVEP
jgi:putative sigma-54 modulation protein